MLSRFGITGRLNEIATYIGSFFTGAFSLLTLQDKVFIAGAMISALFTAATYFQHRKTERAKQEYYRLAALSFRDAMEYTKGVSVQPEQVPRHIRVISRLINKAKRLEPKE